MTSRADIATEQMLTAIAGVASESQFGQPLLLDKIAEAREALDALLRQHGYFDPERRRVVYSREEKEMEQKTTIRTPWHPINRAIGGFAGGDTILLPAPLGGSKTSAIHAIAGGHLRLGHPTTLVELEMGSVHSLIGVARNYLQSDFVPEVGEDLDRLVARLGGAEFERLQYAPYIAEVVMDRAKMETRLRWVKSRLPFPHFDAVYEYVPCAPALRNPRGYLRLKESVDHAAAANDADAAKQAEADRLNRELVALQTHLERWAATGAPPALFAAGREVPVRVFRVEEGECAGQRAVVASEFEAAWKAASTVEPEVFDRAWKMLRKNGGLLLHGFDVRRLKVRASSARNEQNYVVWEPRAAA